MEAEAFCSSTKEKCVCVCVCVCVFLLCPGSYTRSASFLLLRLVVIPDFGLCDLTVSMVFISCLTAEGRLAAEGHGYAKDAKGFRSLACAANNKVVKASIISHVRRYKTFIFWCCFSHFA